MRNASPEQIAAAGTLLFWRSPVPLWWFTMLVFFVGAPALFGTLLLFCKDHQCAEDPPTISWAASHKPAYYLFTPAFTVVGLSSVLMWLLSHELLNVMAIVGKQELSPQGPVQHSKLLLMSRAAHLVSTFSGVVSGCCLITLANVTLQDNQWVHTAATHVFFGLQVLGSICHTIAAYLLNQAVSSRNDVFKYLFALWEPLRLLMACTLLISLVMLLLCFVIVNGYYAYDGWLPITPHMYMIVEVSACLLALAYSPVVGLQARACRALALKRTNPNAKVGRVCSEVAVR